MELSLSQLWHRDPPWLLAQDTNSDSEPVEVTMLGECVSEIYEGLQGEDTQLAGYHMRPNKWECDQV